MSAGAFARSVSFAGALTLCAVRGAIPQETCRRTSLVHPGWAAFHVGRTSTSGTILGAQVGERSVNGVGIAADVEIARFTDAEAAGFNQGYSDLWSFRIGGAYLLRQVPTPVAVCLTASVEYERLGDLRILSVPAGIALGQELALSSGAWHAVPLLEPRIAFWRGSVRDFTSVRPVFSVRGSTMFRSGDLFVGPIVDWAATGYPRWVARVRFGGTAF